MGLSLRARGGVTTQKDNDIYLHILDWKDEELAVPLTKKVVSARLLRSGEAVPFEVNENGVTLRVPVAELKEWDAVVKLTVAP